MQDLSGDMDLLAVLLTMSNISSQYPFAEAFSLVWYGKIALQDPLLDRPYNERRCSSLEPIDPKYEVKVLRNKPHSQILQSFDGSNRQVVALVPGQALNCGIGPIEEFFDKQRVTYLSAKDVLRWSKLSEWLDKFDQRNETDEVAISQTEDLDYSDSLYRKLSDKKIVPWDALSVHVSDLPVNSSLPLGRYIWVEALFFVSNNNILLILLVALPLVYGGIHLTTWNFHFASQTEQLLWKIACVDIMGTIPISVIFFGCISHVRSKAYRRWSIPEQEFAMLLLVQYTSWILFTPLFIFYALSRIYIVVESFISLRHVPIGVYAAIPWVQDIPHI